MCSSFCVHLQYVAQFRSQGFFGLMKVLEYTFIVNCSRNHWVVLAFFDLKNTLWLHFISDISYYIYMNETSHSKFMLI